QTLEKPTGDARLIYFKRWLRHNEQSGASARSYIYAQYARAMKFLYEKEFLVRDDSRAPTPAAATGSLYQNRGHSTDTQIEANYAVYVALAITKAQLGAQQTLKNVLIVGPGLDFAPRTDLIDVFEPQSYQPFAAADAILGLGLADRKQLRIHSIDINDRVVDYLQNFSARKVKRLSLLSGVADTARQQLTADYQDFFAALGRNIGAPSQLAGMPANYPQRLGKSINIDDDVGRLLSAEKLNIITERYDPAPRYDLVIVTNVFPYFSDAELLLALSNIASMIAEGGHLIHNESRPVLSALTEKLKLRLLHSRQVLISSNKNQPLYDRVYVHQKPERF
ncbi:MAG: class I SAM-dependent methyltransferase, partial [Pyrinomonadaceae bacterium]